MRFAVYCGISAAICGLMLMEALLVYPNLFSALVGLSDSVVKVCALINLACCLTILWTKMVLYIFLGGARANELQTLYNKGWMFLCNSILYWSVRDLRAHITAYDLGVCMLSIFVLIALHWICNERVKVAFYETEPVSYFNVARLGILCAILGGIDIALCYRAVTDFLQRKYTLSLFGMFLLDLLEMSVIFVGHYIINFCEMIYLMRNDDEDEWDRKVLLQTIVNLTSCILGIVVHCLILYVFSLNTSDTLTFGVRVVNLYQDCKELFRLLRTSSEVDKFSVPAEASDLERDNTCVICRDEMSLHHRGHPKKSAQRLQCGHVMHASCLKSWMARSDKCPTCRQSVHTAASAFATVEERPGGEPEQRDLQQPQPQPQQQQPLQQPQQQQQQQQPRRPDVALESLLRNYSMNLNHGDLPLGQGEPRDTIQIGDIETPANRPAVSATEDSDEDVSDLFVSRTSAEPTPVTSTTAATTATTTSGDREPVGASTVVQPPSPAEDSQRLSTPPPSFDIMRETPFSGRIVSRGNVSQAYTFRERYLF